MVEYVFGEKLLTKCQGLIGLSSVIVSCLTETVQITLGLTRDDTTLSKIYEAI